MPCEYQPTDLLLCVASVTDCPVPMVYALISRPVSYPDWLETNIEYRLLDMRIWWSLTSFAVRDRTVGAMVWQIWHKPSVTISRHYKAGLAFLGELPLGYISLDIDGIVWVHSLWWYCIPASWHFAVHPHLPIQETKWQLTWLWHVWYFICDDTLSQRQCHGNIIVIFICYKICMPTCYIYITQTCYIEHFY
jgi:hypothetical protein